VHYFTITMNLVLEMIDLVVLEIIAFILIVNALIVFIVMDQYIKIVYANRYIKDCFGNKIKKGDQITISKWYQNGNDNEIPCNLKTTATKIKKQTIVCEEGEFNIKYVRKFF
jgi:hypothetical protein